MVQQKQDEYVKQLASKVNVLTTHNRTLEAQIAQKATFSSTPLDRLPSKPKPNPCEQFNCVTMKEEEEDLTDPVDSPMEEGREIIKAENKERNNDKKTATLKENDTVEILPFFHLSSLTQVVFLSHAL